ncbi:hypothetical protein [Xanthobacter sp.]|uniref:hypothetical protein n=1 Tax=Xanthobacter sp. TaxID=35809 RepID=UPI0025D57B28|nr:hypothetical protein [Xanthobacter sp.]
MIVQIIPHHQKALKRQLQRQVDAKSAHLTEAIARACGFRTHAALQADMEGASAGLYVRFDNDAFRARLHELTGKSAPSHLDLPELDRSARYVKRLFENPRLEIIRMQPMSIRFRLAGIPTVVAVDLHHTGTGVFRFRRSHAIHTPTQIAPYWPGRDFDDDPAYGMNRAITSITDNYEQAVADGHVPNLTWLVAA